MQVGHSKLPYLPVVQIPKIIAYVSRFSVTQCLIASRGQVWWVPAPARPPTVSRVHIYIIIVSVLHGPFVLGLLERASHLHK